VRGSERVQGARQDSTQKGQPPQQQVEVIADRGQHRVDRIPLRAGHVIAAIRCSPLGWPIVGWIAARRRKARLIATDSPRFWPAP
jgi:hypothetical protein